MNTKDLPHIGLERFKKHPEYTSYIDDDIAVIDSLSSIMNADEELAKIDCFMIVFCQEGDGTFPSIKSIPFSSHKSTIRFKYMRFLSENSYSTSS